MIISFISRANSHRAFRSLIVIRLSFVTGPSYWHPGQLQLTVGVSGQSCPLEYSKSDKVSPSPSLNSLWKGEYDWQPTESATYSSSRDPSCFVMRVWRCTVSSVFDIIHYLITSLVSNRNTIITAAIVRTTTLVWSSFLIIWQILLNMGHLGMHHPSWALYTRVYSTYVLLMSRNCDRYQPYYLPDYTSGLLTSQNLSVHREMVRTSC